MLLAIITPLLSLTFFSLGIGLLNTLLTIKAHLGGSGVLFVGLMTACYYLGMSIGSVQVGHILRRVGHIRLYSSFAAILTVATLFHGLFDQRVVILILRAIAGYCIAALYVSIQSWLLTSSPSEKGGTVLSIYMLIFYTSTAISQFFLTLQSGNHFLLLFCIISAFCSFSIVPMTLTSSSEPMIDKAQAFNFSQLCVISKVGLTASFMAGLFTSAVYGIFPLCLQLLHFSNLEIAIGMSSVIFGAMFFQYPSGYLADHIQKIKILYVTVSLVFVFSLLLTVIFSYKLLFFVTLFFLGGVTFTIYPLSISYTCDYLHKKDIVSAVQGLLLVNGAGSIVGPVVVAIFMLFNEIYGFYIFFLVFSIILMSLLLLFKRKSAIPKIEQKQYLVTPHSSATIEKK